MPASPGPADLVSVIVPAYNHQAYVAEAIESVLAQPVEFELIVVDDGSTDGTGEIADQYRADARVQVIHQRNGGAHAAINRGLSLARGRYVAILNSDDRFAPNRLPTLMALARSRHPLPTFAVTAVRPIDGLGQVIDDPSHPWLSSYREILEVWHRDQDPLQTLLWGDFAVSTSNLFADRILVESLGPMRPRRHVLGWEYALNALVRCPEAFVFRPDLLLLDCRIDGGETAQRSAVRGHLEAAHLLRSAIVAAFGPKLARPLRRIALLERFLRREEWLHRVHENKVLTASLNDVRHERDAAHAALAQGLEDLEALKEQLRAARAEVVAGVERERLQAQRAQALDAGARQTKAMLADATRAEAELHAMQESVSWRITSPLRRLMNYSRGRPQLRGVLMAARKVAAATLQDAQDSPGARESRNVAAGPQGLSGPAPAPRARDTAAQDAAGRQVSSRCTADYALWLDAEARVLETFEAQAPRIVAAMTRRPRFSIVLPVCEADPAMLEETFDSVFAQWYPDWELCLCDDASNSAATRSLIDRRVQQDAEAAAREARSRRIRMVRRDRAGHVVAASNDALALAEGDCVVLLGHDDRLAPHALLRIARAIAGNPDAQVIYGDEDWLDEQGLRCLPFFKPDWSPALLATQNYVGHPVCVRRLLMRAVGGFRDETEGSHDYDLLLRLAQQLGNPPAGGLLDGRTAILHLPEVLCHRRMRTGPDSSGGDPKPYAHEAGRLALERALDTRYGDAFDWVEDGPSPFTYAPRFRRPEALRVSIVVAIRDRRVDRIEACVRSIRATAAGADWELLLVDNGPLRHQPHAWLAQIQRDDARVRVLPAPMLPAAMPFSWARLANVGARSASGQVLLFLDGDTEVITEDWLGRLAEWALLPDVGTVGAQLLHADGTIRHAGVAVGIGGWAGDPFSAMAPGHLPSPTVASQLTRNVLASAGACLAISRRVFDALGGFDEEFETCGGDIDIAVRAHRRGLQNVHLADVRLRVHESEAGASHVPQNDLALSRTRFAPYLEQGDPFWNPNLSRDSTTPLADGRYVARLAEAEFAGFLSAASACDEERGQHVPRVDVPEVAPIVARASPAAGARLNLLLPSLRPQHLHGGVMTALQFFLALGRGDARLRIVLTDQAGRASPHELPEPLRDWKVVDASDNTGVATGGRTIVAFGARAEATLPVGAGDVFVATAWWTAHCAQRLIAWQARQYGAAMRPLLYLVQDFEPGFYPWSTRHVLALATYTWDGPMLAVFDTGLLRAYFGRQGLSFEHAWSFEPPLAPALARAWALAEAGFDKRRRLIVHGRPDNPRDGFELVCQGLRHWCENDPASQTWDLHSVGEPHAPLPMPGGNRLVSLGRPSPDDYAAALSEAAIGLSLMLSPHPGHASLEMASFGVRVVTSAFASKDLGYLGDGVACLRAPTPESIGQAIERLAEPWRNRKLVHVDRPAAGLCPDAAAAWPIIGELRASLGLD